MSFSLTLYNELYKRLLILWDYKFNIFMQFFMMILIFVGASFILGGGSFRPALVTPMLLGYVVWFYARIVITTTSSDILSEAQIGTLEQMYMSPTSPTILLFDRMIATLLTSTVIVVLPATLLIAILGIHFPFRWEGLVIFALTLVGLFGFSLMLCGTALVFKQIDSLADLFQNVLLFLTGSLLPITSFPSWLAIIAQTLPTTQGILVLRAVVLQGQSLPAAWNNGSLVWLIINSCLYLCVGIVVFRVCERYAKQKGSLGQY